MSELIEVSGVVYDVLAGTAITTWVRDMASREWEPDDFDKWGQDMLVPVWSVQVVPVAAITMRQELLASAEFQAELKDRTATQIGLMRKRTPIPPLVLRGGDLFLFDGYARAHALKALDISECLAYVSQRRSTDRAAAMSLVMELGVLLRGGELPGQVRLLLGRLIGVGTLKCVAQTRSHL